MLAFLAPKRKVGAVVFVSRFYRGSVQMGKDFLRFSTAFMRQCNSLIKAVLLPLFLVCIIFTFAIHCVHYPSISAMIS